MQEACNFSCIAEGLLKVTGSHLHCECRNILEIVQDRDLGSWHNGKPLRQSDL